MALSDELTKLYAASSASVTVNLSDYSSDSYSLSYVLRGARNTVEVQCTANADGSWTFAFNSTQTKRLEPGTYAYYGYVTGTDSKEVADTGHLTVIGDPLETSWAEIQLEAIESVIEERATNDQLTTAIAGTQLQYMTPDQLIRWRTYFKAEVEREHDRRQRDLGIGSGPFLYTEFR